MDAANTDVVILCGGLGTRLKSCFDNVPKPMIPIHGKPFLEILIENVRSCGFERFILATGYGADLIHRYFDNYEGAHIAFSCEREPLDTAGALKNCEGLITNDSVMVMNGDSLLPLLDYSALCEFHEFSGGIATVAVTKAVARHDAGFVIFDQKGHVLSFAEKEKGSSAYINGGVYLFQRKILERILPEQAYSIERELLPGLSKHEFYAYVVSGPCYDIGTPERLENFRIRTPSAGRG